MWNSDDFPEFTRIYSAPEIKRKKKINIPPPPCTPPPRRKKARNIPPPPENPPLVHSVRQLSKTTKSAPPIIKSNNYQIDYSIVFDSAPLGFSVKSALGDEGAIVSRVDDLQKYLLGLLPQSKLIKVNDILLMGRKTSEIVQIIQFQMQRLPIVIHFQRGFGDQIFANEENIRLQNIAYKYDPYESGSEDYGGGILDPTPPGLYGLEGEETRY